MNSLPNHHFQNKSFYQLSFDGGHLTQYGGLIFFQELFSQLKLKERISKYLVTNDQRRYWLMPTFQNCWKEGSLLHSQPYPVFFPELTRKQSIICDASTLNWSNSFYSFTS
ncbi:IS1380-Spn1 transposase [Streptococcus pneumoniae]|nr:IS1380-Spn1 transposase [Streptococcus pneumoniae]